MQSETSSALNGAMHGAEANPLLFRNLSWAPRTTEVAPTQSADVTAAADLPRVVEAAREEGRREAETALAEQVEQRVLAERQSVAHALDGFLVEKRRYFAGLEKEVVRLALAIAERVLHRETAMDPTLLAGVARIALEQVDEESAAVLLVSSGDLPLLH